MGAARWQPSSIPDSALKGALESANAAVSVHGWIAANALGLRHGVQGLSEELRQLHGEGQAAPQDAMPKENIDGRRQVEAWLLEERAGLILEMRPFRAYLRKGSMAKPIPSAALRISGTRMVLRTALNVAVPNTIMA